MPRYSPLLKSPSKSADPASLGYCPRCKGTGMRYYEIFWMTLVCGDCYGSGEYPPPEPPYVNEDDLDKTEYNRDPEVPGVTDKVDWSSPKDIAYFFIATALVIGLLFFFAWLGFDISNPGRPMW